MTPTELNVLTERLIGVLERENAVLRAMDLRGATALLGEKTAAIDALAAAAPPDPTAGTAPLAAGRRLHQVALENRRLLHRAITAQKRVIGIVARAAAAAASEGRYAASGRPCQPILPMAFSARV